MKINLIPSVEMIRKSDIKGKVVVIIDVLRATSVITTALANGATAVLPVVEVQDALAKKTTQVLLGGERKAMKIEGFDLSNSPLEYEHSFVQDRTIVLSTTNGTKAIHRAIDAEARSVLIGCMLNASAVAKSLIEIAERDKCDIAVLCAGTYGDFSLDDYICAGKIIRECVKDYIEIKPDDFSKAALMAYESNEGNILSYLSHASHYEYLISIGLEQDIHYCFTEDLFDVVPRIKQNKETQELEISL